MLCVYCIPWLRVAWKDYSGVPSVAGLDCFATLIVGKKYHGQWTSDHYLRYTLVENKQHTPGYSNYFSSKVAKIISRVHLQLAQGTTRG